MCRFALKAAIVRMAPVHRRSCVPVVVLVTALVSSDLRNAFHASRDVTAKEQESTVPLLATALQAIGVPKVWIHLRRVYKEVPSMGMVECVQLDTGALRVVLTDLQIHALPERSPIQLISHKLQTVRCAQMECTAMGQDSRHPVVYVQPAISATAARILPHRHLVSLVGHAHKGRNVQLVHTFHWTVMLARTILARASLSVCPVRQASIALQDL